jgi:hypothetical protein
MKRMKRRSGEAAKRAKQGAKQGAEQISGPKRAVQKPLK